jgi:hypothetical protein
VRTPRFWTVSLQIWERFEDVVLEWLCPRLLGEPFRDLATTHCEAMNGNRVLTAKEHVQGGSELAAGDLDFVHPGYLGQPDRLAVK